MFKIRINHSFNYLVDLFKLPPRKGLRSTCSSILEYLLIVLMLNLQFPTVALFYGTLFPPLLLLLLLYFVFLKLLKMCGLNCS